MVQDLLQQPVMLILSQEVMFKKEKMTTWLEQKTYADIDVDLAQFPMDFLHATSTERWVYSIVGTSSFFFDS